MTVFLVALLGGLGAAARFLFDTLVARWNPWSVPLGTVVVNLTASVALGLLTGWSLSHTSAGDTAVLLGTGFLGGYSTFSTASVEGARLIRTGRPWAAAVHAGGMALVSLSGALLGLSVAWR
jgi:CrcB protein